jgi:hypothetical protein
MRNAETTPPYWTAQLPARAGWYEINDPDRGVNRIVRVFRARNGELAVGNSCPCKHAFYLRMWLLPCFRGTVWRGPVEVPSTLPETWPPASANGGSRRCLLGEHDDF